VHVHHSSKFGRMKLLTQVRLATVSRRGLSLCITSSCPQTLWASSDFNKCQRGLLVYDVVCVQFAGKLDSSIPIRSATQGLACPAQPGHHEQTARASACPTEQQQTVQVHILHTLLQQQHLTKCIHATKHANIGNLPGWQCLL